jgi:hypothetical protein
MILLYLAVTCNGNIKSLLQQLPQEWKKAENESSPQSFSGALSMFSFTIKTQKVSLVHGTKVAAY